MCDLHYLKYLALICGKCELDLNGIERVGDWTGPAAPTANLREIKCMGYAIL